MRKVVLPLVALTFATPAFAESEAQRDVGQVAETLNSPITQGAIAGAVGGMMGPILDIRIDGIAKALEPLNGGRPVDLHGRTLRDLAERDDPNFERSIQDKTRAAAGAAGSLASAMALMLPELEAATRRMKAALPDMH